MSFPAVRAAHGTRNSDSQWGNPRRKGSSRKATDSPPGTWAEAQFARGLGYACEYGEHLHAEPLLRSERFTAIPAMASRQSNGSPQHVRRRSRGQASIRSSIGCVIRHTPAALRRKRCASRSGFSPTTRPSGMRTPRSMTTFVSRADRPISTLGQHDRVLEAAHRGGRARR